MNDNPRNEPLIAKTTSQSNNFPKKHISRSVKPLIDVSYESLDWEKYNAPIQFNNMIRIYTESSENGSFYHALINASFRNYRLGIIKMIPITQSEIIRRIRYDISFNLGSINQETGLLKWQELGDGTIMSMSSTMPEYSLPEMQKNIMSSNPSSVAYEFISDQLNRDIYILSAEHKDVMFNHGYDYSKLYKKRDSVVLLSLPGLSGHYELVGLNDTAKGTQQTLFTYNHPFIQTIRQRISNLS